MKKLIALLFCLALLGTAAQAQQKTVTKKVAAPKKVAGEMATVKKQPSPQELKMANVSKAVDQKVTEAKRKVTLIVCPARFPKACSDKNSDSRAEGEAVIVGNNENGNLVLLASKNLTNEIDILAADNVVGKIVQDARAPLVGLAIRSDNTAGHLYEITMPATDSFTNFKMLSKKRARELLELK